MACGSSKSACLRRACTAGQSWSAAPPVSRRWPPTMKGPTSRGHWGTAEDVNNGEHNEYPARNADELDWSWSAAACLALGCRNTLAGPSGSELLPQVHTQQECEGPANDTCHALHTTAVAPAATCPACHYIVPCALKTDSAGSAGGSATNSKSSEGGLTASRMHRIQVRIQQAPTLNRSPRRVALGTQHSTLGTAACCRQAARHAHYGQGQGAVGWQQQYFVHCTQP